MLKILFCPPAFNLINLMSRYFCKTLVDSNVPFYKMGFTNIPTVFQPHFYDKNSLLIPIIKTLFEVCLLLYMYNNNIYTWKEFEMNVINYGVGITEGCHQKLVMPFYSNNKRIWNRFYAYLQGNRTTSRERFHLK